MKEDLRRIKEKDMVYIHLPMGINMKEIGRMMQEMEKEFFIFIMEKNMKEILKI